MQGRILAERYELLRPLGAGGMASVWLARDRKLSRDVSVKLLHAGLSRDVDRERFRREALLLASLRHEHVLEVYDCAGPEESAPWLVAEYVDGEDLGLLAARERPTPELAALLCWAVAEALGAAHSRGILHRDVKPANVLVAADGRIKLADFGIARGDDDARLTASGELTGSLAYLAPERLEGGAEGPAADVFSVGVMLHELCAGRLPYEATTAAALVAQVLAAQRSSLAQAAPAAGAPICAVAESCLARDPAQRPVDGRALAAALAAALVEQGLGAPEAELARWRRDRAGFEAAQRRTQAAAAGAAGKAAFAAGDGAAAARHLARARAYDPAVSIGDALGPGAPSRRWAVVGAAAAVVAIGAAGILVARGASGPRPAAPGLAVAEGPAGPLAPEPPRDGTSATPSPAGAAPATAEALVAGAPVAGGPEAGALVAGAPVAGGAGAEAPGAGAAPAADRTAPAADRTAPAADRTAPAADRTAPAADRTAPAAEAGSRGSTPAAVAGRSAAPAPAAPAPAAPAPSGTGTLQLTTRPWAEVFVDGVSRGTTPKLRSLTLPVGPHELRLENPACEPVSLQVKVVAGQEREESVTLPLRSARLTIRAPVGAALFLDGAPAGTAPLATPLLVPAGSHELEARLGGKRSSQTVVVRAGDERPVELRP